MADPKDIEFRLKTEADTSGAEEVKDALQDVGKASAESTQAAKAEADKALSETKKAIDDLQERAEALKKDTREFGDAQEAANAKMRLGAATMTGVAAGGAIVAKIFGEIGAAIKSIDIENLRSLNAEMATQVEEVQAWGEVLTDPINGIQRLISGASISEVFADLNEGLKNTAENDARLNKERVDAVLREVKRVAESYDAETAALVKQREELERIITLRGQLAGLRSEGLGQETESAQIRGGDVALAKSNELANQLQAGLQELGGNLQRAEADRGLVQEEFDSAVSQYEAGVKSGLAKLNPAELEKLGVAVDTAREKLSAADEALADQKQIFAEAKGNLLRGVENELARLDTDTKTAASTEAAKVRDSIYETLKSEVTQMGQDTTRGITEAFGQLRDNQQKANDKIVGNTGELITLVRTLAGTVNQQKSEIDGLKSLIQSIPR